MNPKFWRAKRVLITGHTGFKGSWLSLWLQFVGADVVGYALRPSTEPNLFDITRVAEGMDSRLGDVRNEDQLYRLIAQYKPEIVFHMAAQALVLESYKDPAATYAVNVMGTVNLLEAVRKAGGVRAVVCVTSDKCYENREWVWGYREYENLGGRDPYSSSKACAEMVSAAYRDSFFTHPRVALATARAGNVIGGGDWSKYRLFTDILRSVTEERNIILRNPQATRPWQHVLDALNGYLILAQRLYEDGTGFDEAWNFGPTQSYPVSHVVDQLLSLWGGSTAWEMDKARYQHEENYLTLDSTKARDKLRWKPALDLNTALGWVVDWMRFFQAGADMRSVTRDQITRFLELTEDGVAQQPVANEAQTGAVHADIFDHVPVSVILRSADGIIKFWNRTAQVMYGWAKEEAIGNVSHALLRTQFPKPLREIDTELAGRGIWEGKLIHTRRDGSPIAVKSRWVLKQTKGCHSANVIEINQDAHQN